MSNDCGKTGKAVAGAETGGGPSCPSAVALAALVHGDVAGKGRLACHEAAASARQHSAECTKGAGTSIEGGDAAELTWGRDPEALRHG